MGVLVFVCFSSESVSDFLLDKLKLSSNKDKETFIKVNSETSWWSSEDKFNEAKCSWDNIYVQWIRRTEPLTLSLPIVVRQTNRKISEWKLDSFLFYPQSHVLTWSCAVQTQSDLMVTEKLPCCGWGFRALLKGPSVTVMKEREVLLFHILHPHFCCRSRTEPNQSSSLTASLSRCKQDVWYVSSRSSSTGFLQPCFTLVMCCTV